MKKLVCPTCGGRILDEDVYGDLIYCSWCDEGFKCKAALHDDEGEDEEAE